MGLWVGVIARPWAGLTASLLIILNSDVTGMVHGDELKYIFNLKIGNFPLVKKGDKDFAFSDKMVKIWTAFAQTGYSVFFIQLVTKNEDMCLN